MHANPNPYAMIAALSALLSMAAFLGAAIQQDARGNAASRNAGLGAAAVSLILAAVFTIIA